jgi:hypothetical protein
MAGGIDLDHELVKFYDGILLGERLAKGKKASKAGGLGRRGGGKSAGSKAQSARNKLNAIAKGVPEAVIKIARKHPKGTEGMGQIRTVVNYVARNGDLSLEDQDANMIEGKEAIGALLDEWQKSGSFIEEVSSRRESFHVILSMPAGVDRLAVERASRDFAAKEFKEKYPYVLVRHDDEDHPHVHLIVKARGYDGKRLNPRKEDLHRWREGFVESLRDHGVEAVATKRQQRLRSEKGVAQAIAQIKARGETPQTEGRKSSPDRIARAIATEAKVTAGYRDLIGALKQSSVDDIRLAAALESRLFGKEGQGRAEGGRAVTGGPERE